MTEKSSIADIIRSTPAQPTSEPPEVGSAKYDDAELISAVGGEVITRAFVTRYPLGLQGMPEELQSTLKNQIEELFFSAQESDGVFVGIEVEVDENNNVTGVKRNWPSDGIMLSFSGGTNPEAVLFNWIKFMIMDPDTKEKPDPQSSSEYYSADIVVVQHVSDRILSAVEVKNVIPKGTAKLTMTKDIEREYYSFTGTQSSGVEAMKKAAYWVLQSEQ